MSPPPPRQAPEEPVQRSTRIWLGLGATAALVASVGLATWWLMPPSPPTNPNPTVASRDLRLVESTFPPKLSLGTRWTVEVEGDAPTLQRTWHPQRIRSELSVAEVAGDLVMVDARDLHFSPEHVRFVLRASTIAVTRIQDRRILAPSLDADVYWSTVEGDLLPACGFLLDPSHLPIVSESTAAGAVLHVLGERHFGDVRQRAWVEDGLVRFEIQPTGHPDAVLTIAWRPGDPWWAKYECFVPGKSDNPLPPKRDGGFGRPARARLIAIDGVPVEPLPWEHPPRDWMEGGTTP